MKRSAFEMGEMAEIKMEKVVGLNCHAKIGQRVQLTEQGRKSLDERFHNISGGSQF